MMFMRFIQKPESTVNPTENSFIKKNQFFLGKIHSHSQIPTLVTKGDPSPQNVLPLSWPLATIGSTSFPPHFFNLAMTVQQNFTI